MNVKLSLVTRLVDWSIDRLTKQSQPPSARQCDLFIQEGARLGRTPAEVVSMCDITFSCVSDPKAARDVSIPTSLNPLRVIITQGVGGNWNISSCAAGAGTQRRSTGHPARQMLRGDVDRRPRNHHRTLAGWRRRNSEHADVGAGQFWAKIKFPFFFLFFFFLWKLDFRFQISWYQKKSIAGF